VAQEIGAAAAGRVAPQAFAGIASDGRDLLSLLYQPSIATLTALATRASLPDALATGYASLDMIVRTQVADAGRGADQVATTANNSLDGYTRVTSGKTCNRCIILAGRFYAYNAGFRRHPRCDCRHVPTSEARAGRVLTDPRAVYEGMSKAERTAAGWTKHEQDALDEGADIFAVTNARNKRNVVYTAGGKEYTREATTRSGRFGGYDYDPATGRFVRRTRAQGARKERRLTVDQIFEDAKSREEMLALLRKHAYLI
jgi:hypothetical protein